MFSATAMKVFFNDSSDQLIDAATGQPVDRRRRPPISLRWRSTIGCGA